MSLFPLKPTHAPVKAYYAALAQFHLHGHDTEGNTRSAFADLLKKCCSPYAWHLVEEYQFKGTNKQSLRADGALVDDLTLVHGLWEAKDSSDDLQAEIKKKVAAGYPLTNILFQSPDRAVLYQDNGIALDCDLTKPDKLIEILELFFEHRQPHEVDWEEAVTKFAEKIPELAEAVGKTLKEEDRRNPKFHDAFASFLDLCRQSINPDLSEDAVRKMLIQHLLTVRIFTRVFQNEDFVRKNVIAAEIEKVIDTISDTYTKSSTAQLRSKLHDPYVRAIRWASDRIGEHGIVCYVTNNGFIDQRAFDGMRKHLQIDFDTIMHIDLKGNARTSGERRRREGGNVFDEPGVGWSAFKPKNENRAICWNISSTGAKYCLATNLAPDYHFVGDTGCFSFYHYAEPDGRTENITDWALTEFRAHYGDKKITKWNIFHATYAVLHHPEYRTRYAANLKRELPRIPFPPDFHAFAAAGKQLMELHIDYEKQSEYALEQIEDPKAEVSFHVDRMKLSKDKSELRYNDFLLLCGIPAAAYDYRLGNRSALEWVIDQYRVSTDPRSGIVNDPNRPDDPKYILRLIGRVITVSLETQRVIHGLPSLKFE